MLNRTRLLLWLATPLVGIAFLVIFAGLIPGSLGPSESDPHHLAMMTEGFRLTLIKLSPFIAIGASVQWVRALIPRE